MVRIALIAVWIVAIGACAMQGETSKQEELKSRVANILLRDGISNPWHLDYYNEDDRDPGFFRSIAAYENPVDIAGKACASHVVQYELEKSERSFSVSSRQDLWHLALVPCGSATIAMFSPVFGAKSDNDVARVASMAFDYIPALGGKPAIVEYVDEILKEAFRNISSADFRSAFARSADNVLLEFANKRLAPSTLGVSIVRLEGNTRVVVSIQNGPDFAFE